MYSRRPRRSTEHGIALLSVLWVLLLLSALAEAATYVVRTNAIVTHRSLEVARAQAAADAAIVHTISQLSDEQVDRHPPTNGSGLSWEFEGFTATISVSNEAGRLDANTASSELLKLDNIVVTPHLAAATADTFEPTVKRMFDNMVRVTRGEAVPECDLVV